MFCLSDCHFTLSPCPFQAKLPWWFRGNGATVIWRRARPVRWLSPNGWRFSIKPNPNPKKKTNMRNPGNPDSSRSCRKGRERDWHCFQHESWTLTCQIVQKYRELTRSMNQDTSTLTWLWGIFCAVIRHLFQEIRWTRESGKRAWCRPHQHILRLTSPFWRWPPTTLSTIFYEDKTINDFL